MPLILNGSAKKVVMISSGHADVELARKYDVFETAEYSISKAAVNMAVAKFSAEYRAKGVLFLSVSPGVVDTANLEGMSESQGAKMMGMVGKFKGTFDLSTEGVCVCVTGTFANGLSSVFAGFRGCDFACGVCQGGVGCCGED
jgi:NAD(P)-dependent dehydrogenase (short-subunit alcohol dehydrogenase family)